MKRIYISVLLVYLSFSVLSAQSSLSAILNGIEVNNKTLKVAKQSTQVQKIDAKTGIYPSDMNVEFEHMFGNEASEYQRESELTVTQELDFPTAYFQKNKIANMRSNQAETQYKIARQNILLEATQLCIELTYYNKMNSILTQRMQNTEELNRSYQKRLQVGDANILESNKISLEYLNVQTEYRLNNVEITNRLQKLSELNGGIEISFQDTVYEERAIPLNFETLLQKVLQTNPELISLQQEKEIASKSVGLAKSMALPKVSVGYKMSISNPEKFHGFVAGLSIPLWENKNTVKLAKAQNVLADMEIDNSKINLMNELKQLYDKVIVLKKSTDEYKSLLSTQNNNQLLYKALSLGQISLLEYLTEVNFLYQSTENSLQNEKDYYLALAELLKVDL